MGEQPAAPRGGGNSRNLGRVPRHRGHPELVEVPRGGLKPEELVIKDDEGLHVLFPFIAVFDLATGKASLRYECGLLGEAGRGEWSYVSKGALPLQDSVVEGV